MKIQLIKIPRKANFVVMGVLFQFLFSNVLLAKGADNESPFSVAEKKTYSQQIIVSGTITSSEDKLPIPGVTVSVKGVPNIGVITDFDGKYRISLPSSDAVLVFSSIGFKTVERKVGSQSVINIVMATDQTTLEEVVIVGYGTQKKESLVAAISQVSGKTLERAGGVSSLGAALTGNAPGLVTNASTGMPGEEDPRIVIRGATSPNGSDVLVLVDGVERPMNSIDIGSVETVSVLKDASATAVYGSRGSNGVILITTKRGSLGKALIRARVNSTMKSPSRLPNKFDAYDALTVRNQAIENELSLSPGSWNNYLPQDIINKYRFPADQAERERYPNVDWAKTLFKDFVMSHNASLNVSGGTEFVKYFSSIDYLHEGDLFRKADNRRGYEGGYGFDRLNVRSNLDFTFSPTTTFKVTLSGSHGIRKMPGARNNEYTMWDAAYSTAPDVFLPFYESDNSWGYFAPNEGRASNSVRSLSLSGVEYQTTTRINTDFSLNQKLDMFVKGLSFTGMLAFDNSFREDSRGVNDLFNNTQEKWIDPATGNAIYKRAFDPNNRFDFQDGIRWTVNPGAVNNGQSYRRLFYQAQLNYNTVISDDHNIGVLALANRNEFATGSNIPSRREDWVFRTTYDYKGKYFAEYNGAYNGSEKFGTDNRYGFFSSGGLSWIVSKENFMKKTKSFVDLLKFRVNYGEVGDDSVSGRFLYETLYGFGGRSNLGLNGEGGEQSPYVWYTENSIGNPEVRWEKVTKTNFGVDFGFLKGFVQGSVDVFQDRRTDILIAGSNRAIPTYYGASNPPPANLGRVDNKGFELQLKLNHTFANGLNLWSDLNMTHAKSNVVNLDDPQLLEDYQKRVGRPLGQARAHVAQGYYNTWDDLYASTRTDANDQFKLPGNLNLLDYNADGVINAFDDVPFGFAGVPQNTYNANFGLNWKNFSFFVQFYGVNNVTRQVVLGSLAGQNTVVYDEGSYWSKDNTSPDVPMPRWLSTPSQYNNAQRFMYDGSYVRLKNAEIAYTFDDSTSFVKALGIQNVRVFVNGDNLYLWSKMPDDRESNFAGTGWASQGAYPTVRRFNLGANIIF
ncbi:SusC/RagA family TonB-linked outer membrane protein [Flavobacterium magnesitis]|uniref:SusC/RagA family TonB-linked outer membrane protein n=1 Tax=Flavobacterium magnesitis TaxID=3138077 RepID=UPI00358E441E